MTLYRPAAFPGTSEQARRLMRTQPFATLVSGAGDAMLEVGHLPLLWRDDGSEWGVLEGHLARANPQATAVAAGATALAIFHGPQAYVSPSWYERPEAAVPTWNYLVVHAAGRWQPIEDEVQTLQLLSAQTAHFEHAIGSAWQPTDAAQLRRLAAAILAFRLPIDHLQIKAKLSQNRGDVDRARVADALAASADPQARATADWMRASPPHAG